MPVSLRHLNFGLLHAPPNPEASCHCWLIEAPNGLVLVDSGIGLHDAREPQRRIGAPAIDAAGFTFHPDNTAANQLESLGHDREAVTDIVLTHADPDHAGGLADFPNALVHMTAEEHAALNASDPRYSTAQFEHEPNLRTYSTNDTTWQGLPARAVRTNAGIDLLLVPLFGHTPGHAGVAAEINDRWHLHAGDAYYLRGELTDPAHPVSALAELRAADNTQRLASLERVRTLVELTDVAINGYHDFTEFAEPPKVAR